MSDLSDWDASSGDEKKAAPAPPKAKAPVSAVYGRRTFEDEEDDVKDDWEQEDEAPKPQPVLAPPKKKGNLKKKLAEKEAEERRRAELGLDSDESEDEDEDPVEKKKHDQEMQLQSDLDSAAALLGQTSVKDTTPGEGLAALKGAKPVTKGDWDKLAQDIYAKVIAGYAGRPGYDKNFGPALILLIADKMRDTDMRLTATKLRDAAEKKARAEKEAKKAGGAQKKPKPKNLSTASAKDGIDTTNYEEGLSDDSFM